MTKPPLCILQVSTADVLGGAEQVARNLFQSCRSRGHESWLAVGHKRLVDPHILAIDNRGAATGWSGFWWDVHSRLQAVPVSMQTGWRLCRIARHLAEPSAWSKERNGHELFPFPGSQHLIALTPQPPDIVHCHNLHGWYFDLEALPDLCRKSPVILTLHDAWLLSGHCAHSFDCDRWITGCGKCPDLTIYPAVPRDATDLNWQRKKAIFSKCRLYVATPSRWLMSKVEQSMLKPAAMEMRVIPNGVDLDVFQPSDKQRARSELGLPSDALILLFAAPKARRNRWKDYDTLQAAVATVSERLCGKKVLFLALGDDTSGETIGHATVRFIPFQSEAGKVARHYQAADLYVHAARADTFPTVILEALACGTPVVATAVGGIPEQVKGLGSDQWNRFDQSEATGVLTPPANSETMASAMERLLSDESLRKQLGVNAVADARQRFDLTQQVDAYLGWYEEMLDRKPT